jgi:hypothetical protein
MMVFGCDDFLRSGDNRFFGRLRAAQGCTAFFDGCKPLKMRAIRKSRFLNGDVEKAIDGLLQM